MKIEEFVERATQLLPLGVALENDRIGIQIKTKKSNINKILLTYEITPEVVDEARMLQVDLLVSFHPLLYYPIDNISIDDRVGFLISELIKADISLVVFHTNFDAIRGGTSWLFAEKLGLKNIDILVKNEKFPEFGFGVVGEFDNYLDINTFLDKVQGVTSSPLRWCLGKDVKIKNVSLVAGSGISFVESALEIGADAFITADIKYHTFHKYSGKIMLVDPGHWEMEYLVPLGFKNLFERIFINQVELYVSKVYTNPVKYFVNENYNEIQKSKLLK